MDNVDARVLFAESETELALDLRRDVGGARSEHEDCVSHSVASIASSISSCSLFMNCHWEGGSQFEPTFVRATTLPAMMSSGDNGGGDC